MTKATLTKQTPARSTAMRMDRWVNERNFFGGSRDPTTRTTFFRDIVMTREFLESLYRYDWVSRRAVEIPAHDATREWIDLKIENPKRKQEAERELDRLGVRERIEELIILSRLYGGATLIIGAWDGRDPAEPLGQVREIWWMAAVDRFLAYPLTFYRDKNEQNFGDVEKYQVSRPMVQGTDVAVVHESRIIRLDGNYLPPLERIRNFTYGASIIENVLEATRQFGIASQGLAGVVQDFIIKKLQIEDLQNLLQTENGQNAIQTRLGELAAGMSMHGIAVFGKDEEFDKIGTPITGLHELADRFVEYVSAATGIPRSRLFNNLSGRLGGDAGANDLRVHYDTIGAFQKTRLRKPVQRLIDIALYPLNFEEGEVDFEFLPLWQMSDKELAEIREHTAQTDTAYINAGVLEPEEVAMSRFAGDGINVEDMNIEVAPRKKFLAEFKKSDPTQERQPAPGTNGGTPPGSTEGLSEQEIAALEGGGAAPPANGGTQSRR